VLTFAILTAAILQLISYHRNFLSAMQTLLLLLLLLLMEMPLPDDGKSSRMSKLTLLPVILARCWLVVGGYRLC